MTERGATVSATRQTTESTEMFPAVSTEDGLDLSVVVGVSVAVVFQVVLIGGIVVAIVVGLTLLKKRRRPKPHRDSMKSIVVCMCVQSLNFAVFPILHKRWTK